MVEIIPAILPKNLSDLERHLERVRSTARCVQIDVVDGVFAPNKTWPYTDRADFETILGEKEGLPFWEDFDFEIDLMVTRSMPDVAEWVQAGAARIIVHIESEDDRGALEALQSFRSFNGVPGVEVALAISPSTPLEKLETLVQYASEIQVMGIERIGFQGESMDERALTRIVDLKQIYPDYILGIDGGVTLENVRALAVAGATRIAVGSALWESDDIAQTYSEFKRIASGH